MGELSSAYESSRRSFEHRYEKKLVDVVEMAESIDADLQHSSKPTVRLMSKNGLYKEPLSLPNRQLVLAQISKPWSIVQRIIGLVVVTYLLSNTLMLIPAGLLWGGDEGASISVVGMLCSLPLLMLFIWMRRPRLVHVQLAEPAAEGRRMHILPDNTTLVTPMPTRFTHHMIRDAGLLDIPPSRTLWSIFSIVLGAATLIFIALLLQPDNSLLIAATLLFAIPAWLAGFSIPVFAWWSYSTRTLNLPTSRHHAESALVAGLVSTIPALMINSVISPWIISSAGIALDSMLAELLIISASAPIGEELCKLLAVWWCSGFIDSPRRGFEVGFTVGLGFAMLENLQYILFSWAGGPLGFTLTSLIRGIGSIPGHALWTGLTGAGFGWFLKGRKKNSPTRASSENIEPICVGELNEAEWQLIDPSTGKSIETTAEQLTAESGLQVDSKGLFYDWNHEKSISTETALPKTIIGGLLIAIAGHAFWNGSSLLVPSLATSLGASEMASLFVGLTWIVVLITGLLLAGSWILREVRSLPDTME